MRPVTPTAADDGAATPDRGSHGSGLRVLIATRWYPAFDNPRRGIFVADQASGLRGSGVDVTVASWETAVRMEDAGVIGADRPTPSAWTDAIATRARSTVPRTWGAPGIPVIRLPAIATIRGGSPADPIMVADRQAETLLAFGIPLAERWPIDLVHAHTGLPDGVAAARLARRLGVPLVVTEHDSSLAARLASEPARQAYRALIGPGCRLVAVSETLRRLMADLLSIPESSIEVIPNPVDVDAFPLVGPAARAPDELLWVGSRQASKGTDTLLHAFARLHAADPGLRLRLLGWAPNAAEEERLRDLARDLGVADAVAFEPIADRATVAAAMARAAVFIHPSPHETFGIVAAEALATGLPVAAVSSGGVDEILGPDGDNGDIAPTPDAEALAAAVRRVLDRRASFDPARMRSHVEARFSTPAVMSRLIALYEELVPSGGPPRRIAGAGVDRDATAAAIASSPGSSMPLVVGMRRGAARSRIAEVPGELAAGLLVVTATGPAEVGTKPPDEGPAWLEVDADRRFRDARGRLGGPLERRSLPGRIARVARHPVRAVRRRQLIANRERLALDTARSAIRDALATVRLDRPLNEILPLDADDLDLVAPLLDDQTELYPTTLRGLVDAWDAAGRPMVAPAGAVRVAGLDGSYDPDRYWSQLHQRHDLSAVGQAGLPPQINEWLYRAMAHNLRAFLRRHGLDRPMPAAAFDVGMGTGYWVRFWRDLGVGTVDGCDLVADAVATVRAEAAAAGAAGTFHVANIADPGSLPRVAYPIVGCLNVLLHIVDDSAFERALGNVAGLVAPGGSLILAEPILFDPTYERPFDPNRHSRARTLERYRGPLVAAGLELIEARQATVLANNPLEAGSPNAYDRYRRWWRFVVGQSKSDPGSARWLGPLMLTLDRVAMHTGQAPTTKFALFRRPLDPPV
jgi:glycosyltransferase involved in cell wall biosynthesis/SAM-dependent methyltransferase